MLLYVFTEQMRFSVRLYIQMELCEADTLHTWLQNRKRRVLERVNLLLWVQVSLVYILCASLGYLL